MTENSQISLPYMYIVGARLLVLQRNSCVLPNNHSFEIYCFSVVACTIKSQPPPPRFNPTPSVPLFTERAASFTILRIVLKLASLFN